MSSIDLHTHVIPPTVIDALLRAPERFGVTGGITEGIKVVARGGKLCFERAHRYRPAANIHTKSSPREMLRRFYFDALTHDAQSARLLIDRVGADHVVLGTDNPFDMGYYDPLAELDGIPGLTAEEREQICGRTARFLLGED